MKRTFLAVLVSVCLIAMPSVGAASGPEVASGHIAAGGPHTAYVGGVAESGGPDGVDSFSFDASGINGVTITTETTDNSGLGYDLDLWFVDADGNYLPTSNANACATAAQDETCTVPDGAVTGYVDAFLGVDLDVTVVEA